LMDREPYYQCIIPKRKEGVDLMDRTIVGVFRSKANAEKAVSDLRSKGFKDNEINIIAKEAEKGGTRGGEGMLGGLKSFAGEDVGGGIATGGTIGGIAGLLAGVGALSIPGIGPIIAAGPIAAALSGAVTGGVAGGLLDFGIPQERGRHYEDRVKEGNIVALVRANENKISDASSIFRQNGAFDVETH
jgi:hypothetical protein